MSTVAVWCNTPNKQRHVLETDLLDCGGELQTELDDPAFGGGEVVGARQRRPAKRENERR